MSWADVVAFAEVHQRGAIAAACPTCGAAPQRGCTLGSGLITPDGTMHRDRVEAHAGRPWPTLDEAPQVMQAPSQVLQRVARAVQPRAVATPAAPSAETIKAVRFETNPDPDKVNNT